VEKKNSAEPVEEAFKQEQFYAEIEKLAGRYFKGKHHKMQAQMVFNGLVQGESLFGSTAHVFIDDTIALQICRG